MFRHRPGGEMVEAVGSLGEAVTGGLLARAVEPEAGEGHGPSDACLNCQTPLTGDYCSRCGQAAHVHRTLGAFWHDVAHSVLHFDGKIWRTLPMLALRPGELTRRYVEGERAKFVSPMALFLFSVFLMFAVVNAFGGPFDFGSDAKAGEVTKAGSELQKQQQESEAELKALGRELTGAQASGGPTADIERKIEQEKRELAVQTRAAGVAERIGSEEAAPSPAVQGELEKEAVEQINLIGDTGWEPLDKAIAKAEANPSLLLYKLQTNAYKFSWALIPISVPFLWLLFLHRRRYWKYKAYDHIVFVTYSIAFMSIGFIVLTLLQPFGVPEAIIGSAFTFIPPIHMYRQLRGAYRLSRWSALWRALLLLNFAFIAAGLFFTLLLMLGVVG
jgi:hypothetical protein